MAEKDFYELLEIEPGASSSEIKRAYRRLALLYHPDSGEDLASQADFSLLTEAYEVLSNPRRRRDYDAAHGFNIKKADASHGFGRLREAAARAASGSAIPQGLRFSGRLNRDELMEEDSSSISSMMSRLGRKAKNLFEGMSEEAAGGGFLRRPPAVVHEFTISVQESILGTTRDFAIPHEGSHRTFNVEIPAGTCDQDVITVRGTATFAGDDVQVRVKIVPDQFVERSGYDLILKIPLTVGETMNGTEIDVPTPDGPVKLKIPPNCEPGKTFRLRERGVLDKKAGKRGNLLVRPYTVIPVSTDKRALDAAKTLDRFYSSDVRAGLSAEIWQIERHLK